MERDGHEHGLGIVWYFVVGRTVNHKPLETVTTYL